MANEEYGVVKKDSVLESEDRVVAERNVWELAQRAQAEIQGQLVIAQKFPRNIDTCIARMANQAARPNFASKASYSFPRGGKAVTGPSVYLARPLAAAWGNMKSGFRVLRDDGRKITVEGYAWDMETNSYYTMQAEFENLIYRKKTGWKKPDERDKRELINKHGAILVRNCILAIVPSDVVDDVIQLCRDTLKKDISKDTAGSRRRIISSFATLGINPERLTAWLAEQRGTDHAKLETIKPDEIVTLREIYNSIVDGNSDETDHFAPIEKGDEPKSSTEKLADQLKKENGDDGGESKVATAESTGDPQKDKLIAQLGRIASDMAYTRYPEVKSELNKLAGDKPLKMETDELKVWLDNIDDLKIKADKAAKKQENLNLDEKDDSKKKAEF